MTLTDNARLADMPRSRGDVSRAPSLDAVARFVHRIADGAHSDGQLLSRFHRLGDEQAYGELIRRHGPMILSACRRVLGHHHDAEDAFQATFLVLARKADTIRQDQSLGAWLFQVAHRLAWRLRSSEQKRRAVSLEGVSEPSVETQSVGAELKPILDEELARLPERYRAALVLCYLEGRSQQEAAQLLTTTTDAVNSRLKRARAMLRGRLVRRGVCASMGALVAALSQAACAALSALLITTTARAARRHASGLASAASPRVLALARGEVATMTPLQKLAACFLLVLACLLVGVSGITPSDAQEPAAGLDDKKEDKAKAGKDTPAGDKKAPRHCILLWLSGGPSQLDTFDPKPGAATGGPFKAIPTATKGIEISEHLPKLAKLSNHFAILRAVSHRDGDHARATFLMRSGRLPDLRTAHPPIPAVLAKELGDEAVTVPGWVCIGPNRFIAPETYSGGFLGPRFSPLIVGEGGDDLPLPALPSFQNIAGDKAEKMRDAVARAFKLEDEKDALREAYGRHRFGQGCLLARRLIQQGVPVVEVNFPSWDTHANNFPTVENLSKKLDGAFATLLTDLRDHKLLDRTLIVCMGEFGRTPRINASKGRDHWPANFCVVLAGAGIAGGKAIGTTNADGTAIVNGAVSPAELAATIYRAVGVDPAKEYRSNLEMNVPLVDKGVQAVKAALK